MCIFVPKIRQTGCTPDESLFNRQASCCPNRIFYWPFQMSLKEKEFHLPLDELTVTIPKIQEKTPDGDSPKSLSLGVEWKECRRLYYFYCFYIIYNTLNTGLINII